MPDSHTDRVAAAVRAELARRRITQRALAAGLDMTQQAVSRRLNGEVSFDVGELADIAGFLGVPLSVLYGETNVVLPVDRAAS